MSIPQVRFPEFNDDWEHKELNELLSESKKKNTDLKYSKEEVLSVSGELGIVNQIEHLGRSYAGASVHNYGVVEVGDIVYTKSPLKANPYGIIKINKGKAGIVSTLYAVYKVNEKTAYGDFLDYYFSLDANTNRYLRPLVRKGAKNTLQVTDEEAIKGKIFLPQVIEQKRIANFFTILDNKINQLKEKKTLLEEYKKGMMQKIFSQEIRFKPALSEAEGGDNGNEFPEWEDVSYGSIFDFYSTNSLSRDYLNYKNGDVKNIHYGDIHTKFNLLFNIKNEPVPYINDGVNISKIPTENYCQVGDLVIADASEDYADIGKAIEIINLNKEKVLAGLHTILARPKNTKMALGFSGVMMQSQKIRKQIMIIAQGTKVLGLSSKQLAKIKIDLPTRKEQTKIANFLSKIDEKIKTVNEQIEETKEYIKGMLQLLFVNG